MKKLGTKKSNKSNKRPPSKQLIDTRLAISLAVLALLVVCACLFFSRGGPANVRRIYYGRVVRSAYHKEYWNLAPALVGLGLNENKHIKSTCNNEDIATDGVNEKKVLFCGVQTSNYVVVNSSNRQKIISAAKQLDTLEKEYGGRMYTNTGPTFDKYFTEITGGVDYNPDFGVTFVRGNYLCEVHMNVAYSNPRPPAYAIQFGCNSPLVTTGNDYLTP